MPNIITDISSVINTALNTVNIKVDPDVLKNASGDVRAFVGSLREIFESIETIVKRSADYWEGEGHNSHFESYNSRQQQVYTALDRFLENAEDLEKIAGVYTETEQRNVEEAEALPVDVIS